MKREAEGRPSAAASSIGRDGVPVGNTYDKYGSANPVVERLMAGFDASLHDLWERARPESILDVGCGEGVITSAWAERLAGARVVGVDLEHPRLRAEWESLARPGLEFRAADATSLPFSTDEFDVAAAIESLEHIADPGSVLAEMARVARRYLLLSVPREPLWRLANLARGAYLGSLGNTPGHVNHWSKRAFRDLLAGYGSVEGVRSPFPWTILLVRLPTAR